ncbi:hypothetical protein CSPX01_09920 [Colletotrichum filicis]|nr:hypothetical protein CSPX01_09920 [Colletotrichum filicis]
MKSQAVSQKLERSRSLCFGNLEHGVFGQRFPHGGKWKLSRVFADCLTSCAAPRFRPQTGASKPRTTVPDQEARSRSWSEASGSRESKDSLTVLHSIFCRPTIKGCGFLASCSSRQRDYSQRHRP